MNDYICFVAGKSGGHLLPCITLAKKICAHDASKKILFFTTQSKLDKQIIDSHDFVTKHIMVPLSSLSPRSFIAYGRFFVTMLFSLYTSFYYLWTLKPKKIISTGGAVSLPVCFMGALLRIPIELIELNAIPGKTVRALAPLATQVMTCFQETQKYFKQKTYLTQYPLRFSHQSRKERKEALSFLHLDQHKKTIFILGGSQGSVAINNLIKTWIEQIPFSKNCMQFIHQTGTNDLTHWQEFYTIQGIEAFTFSFFNNLEYCYSAADLIICRSGAGTLFEVAFFNKPCITIPLETMTTNHQLDNARAFKKAHRETIIVSQKDTDQKIFNTFNETITKMLHDRSYL